MKKYLILFLLSVFSVISVSARSVTLKCSQYCINYGTDCFDWEPCQKTCTFIGHSTIRQIISSTPTSTIHINGVPQKIDNCLIFPGKDDNGEMCDAILRIDSDTLTLDFCLVYPNKTIHYKLDVDGDILIRGLKSRYGD